VEEFGVRGDHVDSAPKEFTPFNTEHTGELIGDLEFSGAHLHADSLVAGNSQNRRTTPRVFRLLDHGKVSQNYEVDSSYIELDQGLVYETGCSESWVEGKRPLVGVGGAGIRSPAATTIQIPTGIRLVFFFEGKRGGYVGERVIDFSSDTRHVGGW
jgi:hypothetical protein